MRSAFHLEPAAAVVPTGLFTERAEILHGNSTLAAQSWKRERFEIEIDHASRRQVSRRPSTREGQTMNDYGYGLWFHVVFNSVLFVSAASFFHP